MPIKQTTPRASLQQAIYKRIGKIENVIIDRLFETGEQVVKYARELPSPSLADFPEGQQEKGKVPPHQPHYIDWSGNLRSSIGYAILKDGKTIHMSDFTPVKGGEEGARKGKAFLESLISNHSTGIALVVVAGMPYAAYVEAKGYDVLDSAEIKAEEIVERLLSKLKF